MISVGGTSVLMTMEDPSSPNDMMTAAVMSSFLVLRIRPLGSAALSSALPRTWAMTATPVSNPDKPSASFGNNSRAAASIISQLPDVPSGLCGKYHSPRSSIITQL